MHRSLTICFLCLLLLARTGSAFAQVNPNGSGFGLTELSDVLSKIEGAEAVREAAILAGQADCDLTQAIVEILRGNAESWRTSISNAATKFDEAALLLQGAAESTPQDFLLPRESFGGILQVGSYSEVQDYATLFRQIATDATNAAILARQVLEGGDSQAQQLALANILSNQVNLALSTLVGVVVQPLN